MRKIQRTDLTCAVCDDLWRDGVYAHEFCNQSSCLRYPVFCDCRSGPGIEIASSLSNESVTARNKDVGHTYAKMNVAVVHPSLGVVWIQHCEIVQGGKFLRRCSEGRACVFLVVPALNVSKLPERMRGVNKVLV